MSNAQERIAGLHRLYVELTGLEVRLDMHREYVWFEFLRKGFSEGDLRLVVGHVRRGIREQRRQPGALKFSNLVVALDRFEEELAEAAAAARQHRGCGPKAQVLREWRRTTAPVAAEAAAAGEVVQRVMSNPEAAAKALEELRRLKESL